MMSKLEALTTAWEETEQAAPAQRYRFFRNLAARMREPSAAVFRDIQDFRVVLGGPSTPAAMAKELANLGGSSLSVTEALAIREAVTPAIIDQIMALAADHIDARAAQLKLSLERQRDEVTAALASLEEATP